MATSEALHAYVKRREMSRFVAEAIEEKLHAKKEELRQAYIMANEDAGQVEATHDWEITLADSSEIKKIGEVDSDTMKAVEEAIKLVFSLQ